jgi:hypothetical protein
LIKNPTGPEQKKKIKTTYSEETMHKPAILPTKAYNKEQALARTYNFMKEYENKIFDWYVIGGRWHNLLAPKINE